MRPLMLVLLVILAACSSVATSTPLPPTPTPTPDPAAGPSATPDPVRAALEQTLGWRCPAAVFGSTAVLNVYNWSTYIAEDTIANFQILCAVAVNYVEFSSEEEMFNTVSSGASGFDVVVSSDSSLASLVQLGAVSPFIADHVPSLVNVLPELLNPNFDPDNRFSIPYQWGTVGIGYNAQRTRIALDSWRGFFEYRDGEVGWINDLRAVLGIALNYLGLDPNTTNPDDVARARDFLVANAANARIVDDDEGQVLLADGTLDAVIEYSGDIFQVIADCACTTYLYSIPREGTLAWVDRLAIPVDSANKRLAEAFLDYLLQPSVAADISNYTAYASPNQVAINLGLIDADLLNNPAVYPDDARRQNLFDVQRDPATETLYSDAWQAVIDATQRDDASATATVP